MNTATDTQATTRTTNGYRGICSKCNHMVAARTGYLGERTNRGWAVEHIDCAAAVAGPTPARYVSKYSRRMYDSLCDGCGQANCTDAGCEG